MKKFMVLFLATVLVICLLLVACTKTTPTSTTTSTTSAVTTTSKPATSTTSSATTTTSKPATTTSSSATTPPATGKYALKLSYVTPPMVGLATQYFKPWTAAIEKASGGQLTITHYAAESLIKNKDNYDATVSGLCDMALIQPEVTQGVFPMAEINQLPFLWKTPEMACQIYWDLMQKYFADEFKAIKVLGVTALYPNDLLTNKTLIKTVSDFQGLKIRGDGKVQGGTITALGATPVEIPTGELFSALEKNTVDGTLFTMEGAASFKLSDATAYRTVVGIASSVWILGMNLKTWNSLPPNIQKAFTDNSGREASAKYSQQVGALTPTKITEIKANDAKRGLKDNWYILPDDERARWANVCSRVYLEFTAPLDAKGKPASAMLEDARAMVAQLSK